MPGIRVVLGEVAVKDGRAVVGPIARPLRRISISHIRW